MAEAKLASQRSMLWRGKQLAVGLFGRHRPCCIELTWAGVVRVRSRDEGEGIVAEAFVEDLNSDAEAVPRKSAPTFKAVHLSFPSGSLREGGYGMTGGAGIIRVQLDGGRAAEEELVSTINSAMSHRAERKVQLHRRLWPMLEQRLVVFDEGTASHTAQLEEIWFLIAGSSQKPPPIKPVGGAPAKETRQELERDWGYLGFQRGDCPQSDLRGVGMLGLHCLLYYSRHHTAMVSSLVEAYNRRNLSYPFAAAGINIVQVLVQTLMQAGVHNSGVSVGPGKASSKSEGKHIAILKSPLFLVFTRLDGSEGERAFEESFCACMCLLEQLWVRHEANYLMFNRILTALRGCIVEWIADEMREPTGSLEGLRTFDVLRVSLPPDPMQPMSK